MRAQEPREWTVKKAALSLGGGCRQAQWAAPGSPVPGGACQMCLEGAGPTKVKGKQPHAGQCSTGSPCSPVLHHYLAAVPNRQKTLSSCSFYLQLALTLGPRQLSHSAYTFFTPSPIFRSEFFFGQNLRVNVGLRTKTHLPCLEQSFSLYFLLCWSLRPRVGNIAFLFL